MTTSYEYYSAQVAHAFEDELDLANFEADMSRLPAPPLSEEELSALEAEHLEWEARIAS
jgi:hypothetical protein